MRDSCILLHDLPCKDSEISLDMTTSERMTEKGQKGQTSFRRKDSPDSSLRSHGSSCIVFSNSINQIIIVRVHDSCIFLHVTVLKMIGMTIVKR